MKDEQNIKLENSMGNEQENKSINKKKIKKYLGIFAFTISTVTSVSLIGMTGKYLNKYLKSQKSKVYIVLDDTEKEKAYNELGIDGANTNDYEIVKDRNGNYVMLPKPMVPTPSLDGVIYSAPKGYSLGINEYGSHVAVPNDTEDGIKKPMDYIILDDTEKEKAYNELGIDNMDTDYEIVKDENDNYVMLPTSKVHTSDSADIKYSIPNILKDYSLGINKYGFYAAVPNDKKSMDYVIIDDTEKEKAYDELGIDDSAVNDYDIIKDKDGNYIMLPKFVVHDSDGNIRVVPQGYRLGIDENGHFVTISVNDLPDEVKEEEENTIRERKR